MQLGPGDRRSQVAEVLVNVYPRNPRSRKWSGVGGALSLDWLADCQPHSIPMDIGEIYWSSKPGRTVSVADHADRGAVGTQYCPSAVSHISIETCDEYITHCGYLIFCC